ncbi:uncharacterized protein LOC128325972 isoform X3 [Hemicordylus capensis]|nr:uncharacterized protein LOC128325972 isoform X3 [Hemicordylus capensis]
MKADLEWERLMKAACQDQYGSKELHLILEFFNSGLKNVEKQPGFHMMRKFVRSTMELMQASSEHPDPMPIFTAAMLTLYKISKTETLRKRQEECVLKQALQSLAKVQGSRRADLSQTLWGKAQEAFGILLRAWLRRDPSITHLLMLMKILDGYIQKGKYVRQLCISSGTALLRCAKDMANINMEEILCQISKPLLEDFQRDKWRTNEDDIVVENLDEEELF